MIAVVVVFVLAFLVCLPVYWRLPARAGLTFVAAVAAVVLTVSSPVSGGWLLLSTVLTHAGMILGDRLDRKGAVTLTLALLLGASLLLLRDLPGPFWIGISYFTLRHIHVLMEWWTDRLARPALPDLLRYQLFLPVLAAGPIHRYGHFRTQVEGRTPAPEHLWAGAERLLVGAFLAVVLGGWLTHRVSLAAEDLFAAAFFQEWLASLIYWSGLYFSFAGFTSVALGCALMSGLQLEENFDRPWRARNLIEFWGRWHMTLSHWCRDYVFQPVAAATRWPSFGVVLSMLAMGLWHGTTAYWTLWGVWQGLGLVLTRYALRLNLALPDPAAHLIGTLSVLCWLTLSRPVIVTLFNVEPP